MLNGSYIRQCYPSKDTGRMLADRFDLEWNDSFMPRFREVDERKYILTLKGEDEIEHPDDSGYLNLDGGYKEVPEQEAAISRELFYCFWKNSNVPRLEKWRLSVPYKGIKVDWDVFTHRDLVMVEFEVRHHFQLGLVEEIGLNKSRDEAYRSRNIAYVL
jgi:CYTH domain-containing protein